MKTDLVFIASSNDDFLMAKKSTERYNYVKEAVDRAFKITIQSGLQINYLNFCIIQSK